VDQERSHAGSSCTQAFFFGSQVLPIDVAPINGTDGTEYFKPVAESRSRFQRGFLERPHSHAPAVPLSCIPRRERYYTFRRQVSGVAMGENTSSFMNGVPELLVLRLLSNDEMYGYELVQAIRDRTQGAITLGEGVVYPTLHALEKGGALKSRRKTVN